MNSFGATHLTFKTGIDSNEGYLDDRSDIGDFEINSDIIKQLIERYKKENNLYDENLNIINYTCNCHQECQLRKIYLKLSISIFYPNHL